MRNFVTALLAMLLTLLCSDCLAENVDVQQLMQRSDASVKVLTARSELTMILSNADGEQRVRKLLGYTQLQADGVNNKRLLRFLAPADIKDTVTLLLEHSSGDDDMWIYLPALKKTRRLVSDNKRDSFVGSDLTFGDLLGHKPTDWKSTLLREESLNGQSVYVIESLPKDEAIKNQTGYSKRILWVDKNNFIPLKSEYWDDTGQFLKTIQVSDVRLVDVDHSKWQFMQLQAENKQNGHKTLSHFDDYQANLNLPDTLFTSHSLEQDQ